MRDVRAECDGRQKSIAKLLEEKINRPMVLPGSQIKNCAAQKKSVTRVLQDALDDRPGKTRNFPINEANANNTDRSNAPTIYKTCNGHARKKSPLKQPNANCTKGKSKKERSNTNTSNKLILHSVQQGSVVKKNLLLRKLSGKRRMRVKGN